MRERGPVWTPDLLTDPRVILEPTMRARANFTAYRSVLAVPLKVEDRVIGALGVGDAAGRVFDDEQIRTVEAFAAQAALALRNARLLGESEQRRREAEVFARLVRQVSASLDLTDVLQQVAEAARELCGADLARIALRDEGTDRMRFHQWAGPIHEEYRLLFIERGKGVGGLVLDTGRPARTDSYADDPRITKDYVAAARANGIVAVMCVPIRVEDRIDGLLFVDNHHPAPFTDRDEAILLQLADHVAIAIHNAALYAETERRRREAEVLAGLVTGISRLLDLDSVLHRVAEGARELCGTDLSMIALREPGSEAMIVRYRAGARPDAYVGRRIEPGKGVGGHVLLTGKPFRSANIVEDPRVTKEYLRWAPAEASVASMAVPILIGDAIEGLLYAQHRTPRLFSDHDEARLVRLAGHAAIAIRNARLFASEQVARAEAEAAAVALRVSEEQYRALAEGSIQGLYIHQDGLIQFANASMARMFGYDDTDEMVGRAYLLLLAPEEHARIESYRAARLRGEPAPTRYEARGIRRDGTRIWIEVLVSLVPWKGCPAVLGTFLDITERRRAADALRRSEQANARLFREAEHRKTLLEQVFASTSDGILVLDLDGRISALNRRGGDLLGVRPELVAGQPLAECLGHAGIWSEPGARALSAAVMATTAMQGGDLETRAPRLQTLQWQSAPTRDAAGAVVGVTVTFRDVTDEREVSRMKSDFVSFVTHQLRTPLSGIRWMLELGAQEAGIPAETAACLADARHAAERLIGLVNDLLDISRLESGRMTVDTRATELGELTESVVSELAPLVRERGHRLSVSGSHTTPPAMADPQLLRQVILNLVSNAIKYQHPGGEIAIRMGRENGVVRWEVLDRGIGIPMESRHRLFEKFYRAENAAAVETEGTGLGLYLVHLIVERLGGRIWFESEEGAGSTFVVTLPVWETEAP
jgi:PAS domain S-box-containing protein